MIVDDNKRTGLRPMLQDPLQNLARESRPQGQQLSNSNTRPLSFPETYTSRLPQADESHKISSPRYSSPVLTPDSWPLPNEHQLQREHAFRNQRPVISPKPAGLHVRSEIVNEAANIASNNILEERFSQLRVQRRAVAGPQNVEPKSDLVEMPSPTQYTPPSSDSSPSRNYRALPEQRASSPNGRPSGPRDMPPPPQTPPHPPKILLDSRPELTFPRTPSPAYNPSRNIATSNVSPHISRKRSIVGIDVNERSPPTGISAFKQASKPNGNMQQQSLRTTSSGTRPTSTLSTDIPYATTITADDLYDRLREYNILIIDVRRREDYDQGHIFAQAIMCIEPLELRSGVSAEELEDRLVISPATELALFERRNEFDLVVYYDQRTRSDGFLVGPPTATEGFALRALYDTLYEFNAYKPLHRPPAVLIGGIDAWTDLVGSQALQVSNTVAFINSTRRRAPVPKPGRPIGRVPMASSNSSLEVRKRRLREYCPLDAEEDKTWRQRAREEEVEASEYHGAQSDDETDSNYSRSDQPISPLVHSYEEFLRKFPEPSGGKQSMMISPRPPRPPPSLPNIPSRPPPAVPRPSYSGVSERESSQLSPTSRQPSSAQPPLYTSRAISQYFKLPRTGLINFSVTCYMNATIQCLLATIPLSQFFLDNRWRDFTQKNWKGSNGIMPEIFANLIRSLWRNDVQAVRPTSLRNFCARLNREWGVDRQQDAKEYLDFLLDCLHEDLNFKWQNTPLRPLSHREEMVREGMPVRQVSKVEWDRYSHRESSFISSLFAGQHASRLRCTTCKNTSTTYEAFYSISVEIPHSGRGDIHECLRSYCQEEMLSGDEVWKCSYCKCEREATKQIIITRAPQFLVVHFKRFSASKTESARKVHTPINFPLHGLNIEPYIIPSATPASDYQHPSAANSDQIIDAAITPPYIYDAYAVMRHLGQSGNGGHYISLVRDSARGCWRKFDDEKVTDFDPSKLRPEHRLQNEQAYLVFYGRAAAR